MMLEDQAASKPTLYDLVSAKRGSQTKIAKRAGVGVQHINKVVHGERPASVRVRRAFSEVLGIAQKDLPFEVVGRFEFARAS